MHLTKNPRPRLPKCVYRPSCLVLDGFVRRLDIFRILGFFLLHLGELVFRVPVAPLSQGIQSPLILLLVEARTVSMFPRIQEIERSVTESGELRRSVAECLVLEWAIEPNAARAFACRIAWVGLHMAPVTSVDAHVAPLVTFHK